ncbi:diguanylate cyclase (GGDEF)-like protein/PAS domain S-box-containing protein [Anoxybacillus mongoliensis]|uniref:Diguanylate cyclase (GGDEF)-like protein/PAS domain S-box-containing protein n=1 Tax=Anoxybacillus mongoliensis TaxID=452565 RepID=A0A7W8JCE8_9BACL|nr:diguanylate cyclase (GGDEF)-like protein/PAS domain S-box-containing protein [Anoxybacillus mongoliensis]
MEKHIHIPHALFTNEHLLFNVMDQLFDIVFLMKVEEGPRFRYERVSPSALHLASLTEKDIGKCIEDIYDHHVANHLNEQYTKAWKTKSLVTFRDRMNVEGMRFAESTLIPILNENGDVTHIVSCTREITDVFHKEEQLEEAQQLIDSLFTHSQEAFILFDLFGRIIRVNEEVERLFELQKNEIVGKTLSEVIPAYKENIEQTLARLSEGKPLHAIRLTMKTKNNDNIYVSVNASPLLDKNGNIIAGFASLLNITDLIQTQKQLKQSEKLHRHIVEAFPDAIIICTDDKITYANSVALHMFKTSTLDDLKNKPIQQWINTVQQPTITAINGEMIPVHIDVLPFPYEPKRTELMLIKPIEPIAENQKDETYIERNDFTEKLTDLLFTHEGVAILLIDVYQFKFINSFLGYENGNELLKQIGIRLKKAVDSHTLWTRIGGDQFAIALAYERQKEVEQLANTVKETLQEPYTIGDQSIRIGIHIGISYAYDAQLCAETLMNNAEKALYFAKMEGTNVIKPYEPHMSNVFTRKIQLENALSSAVENKELFLLYQPKVNFHARSFSVEALVRWKHPQFGFVSPAEFIPMAEETNAIYDIGKWVLRQACRDLTFLRQSVAGCMKIAINLSAKQFLDERLVEDIQHILQEERCDASCFIFEITETTIIKNPEHVVKTLEQLKQLGFSIAVDDFGVSYSSLEYLNRFPIDEVKIDRSFIQNIINNEKSKEIVSAIISLSHNLHLTVTAEGVETQQQAQFLIEKQCEQLQGFYFSRPVSLEQLPNTIASLQQMVNALKSPM